MANFWKRLLGCQSAPKIFTDATVIGVMVGGEWHAVDAGSWVVDLRGPFYHAGWKSAGVRCSAFIAHVQMVRHQE